MKATLASPDKPSALAASMISERTEYLTFSPLFTPASARSYPRTSSGRTVLLEKTLTSLMFSSLTITSFTRLSSIAFAISLVISVSASQTISPVRGFTTVSARVVPMIRAASATFLLYLYLPTGARSYLLGSKNILFTRISADSTCGGSPGRSFL